MKIKNENENQKWEWKLLSRFTKQRSKQQKENERRAFSNLIFFKFFALLAQKQV